MKSAFNWLKSNIPVIMISVIMGFVLDTIAETSVPSIGVSYNSDKTNETTVNGALNELFSAVDINEKMIVMQTEINNLKNTTFTLDKTYPIGSIYISTSATNPSSIMGGTWVAYGTGKTLVGVDTKNTNFSASEKTGGSSTVTLATANLPSHSHSIPALSGTAASNGAHTHTVSGTVSSTFAGSSVTTSSTDTNHTHDVSGTTGNQSANHTHSIPALSGSTNSTGNHTHTPYLHSGYDGLNRTLNAGTAATAAVGTGISAVTIDGDTMWSGILSTNGAHSHTVSTTASTTGSNSANHYHTISFKSGFMNQNNTHSHTVTAKGTVSSTFSNGSAASNGAHTHTVSTTASTSGSTGSGTSFSVQNPYITVYMWKRTA